MGNVVFTYLYNFGKLYLIIYNIDAITLNDISNILDNVYQENECRLHQKKIDA